MYVSSSFCVTLDVGKATSTIAAFSVAAGTLIYAGYGIAPWIAILVWIPMNIVAFRFILPGIARAIFARDGAEGTFRYAHARIREYAESMMFYKANETEKKNVEHHYDNLVVALKHLAYRKIPLSIYGFIMTLGPFIGFLAVDAYLAWFQYSNLNPAKLSAVMIDVYRNSMAVMFYVTDIFTLSEPLSKVLGNSARIATMLDACKEAEAEYSDDHIRESSDSVEFNNITCLSPKGLQLVANLNVTVVENDHLLFMGPSGSGKSSLLRLLVGIWRPEQGTISRPVTIGRNGIFFLPQNPYIVRGTLKDQLIYPNNSANEQVSISDEQAMLILKRVNLEYLADMYGLDQFVKWNDKLSKGELQRLNIARLFFHQPKFAVLDESTSALDEDNEELVYQGCLDMGITCISVAHRHTVKRFHKQIVTLDGKGNYLLERNDSTISRPKRIWKELASHINTTQNEEELEPIDLSEKHSLGNTGVNLVYLKRLARLLRIMLGGSCCTRYTALLIITLVATSISQFSFVPLVSSISKVFTAIMNHDFAIFLLWLGLFAAFILVAAVLNSIKDLLVQMVSIMFRTKITKFIHNGYFSNNAYYKLIKLDGTIDNTDQRIAADVDAFTGAFSSYGFVSILAQVLGNGLTTLFISGSVAFMFGWPAVVILLVTFSVIFVLNLVFMQAAAKYQFIQDRKEGHFRFILSRLKEYSEQIVFYHGKEKERKLVMRKFHLAQSVAWTLYMRKLMLSTLRNTSQAFKDVISWSCMIAAVQMQTVSLQGNTADVVGLISSTMVMVELVIQSAINLVGTGNDIAVNIGSTGRVGQFLETMDKMEHMFEQQDTDQYKESDIVSFDDVTCVTPTRTQTLFRHLNCHVDVQQHLIVIGPSGTGKSSLIRILAKLWPLYKGTIARPMHDILFLPQNPYMTFASLRQQICYPDAICKYNDDELLGILERVNMGYLVERLGSWDMVKEWSTVLSPGEQQRLGFARLLYHQVKYAILDESTSALDLENEAQMYRECLKQNMTLVSVGHRDTLFQYHVQILELNKKGWKLFQM